MNQVLNALIALAAAAVAVPALAGPDFIAIEQARKAKRAARVAAAEKVAAPAAARDCPARLVLPLDHGPRAVTTPYVNEQRKARYEAQKKACERTGQADTLSPNRAAG